MRMLLFVSALALLAAAQWALDPGALGYRGWALSTNGTLPTSLSATVQLLPTPYWQEWIVGNWTAGFVLGRGCVAQAGPLRYGIYVSRTAFIETPPVRLGQNFTVIAVVKPRHLASDYGWIWLWRKDSSRWFGEISATYEGTSAIPFYTILRAVDVSVVARSVRYNGISRNFATLTYVGEYRQHENTYYMYIYLNGTLVGQTSFSGQRGDIQSSAFRLGSGGEYVEQHLWYVAFAVYNRSLSASEVAAWRPEAPAGGDLVMYYYAHPQFVRDIDGDGVLEWLDPSNNRHAKLRGGAAPQWFVEPAVLQTQRCGGVSLAAQWDGFTATYAVNGTQRSIFEPGRVHFDGRNGYAVVPVSFYGWQGLTIEQYVYILPCKPNRAWSKTSMYGSFAANNTYVGIFQGTNTGFCNQGFSFGFGYRRPDGSVRDIMWYSLALGRWQHVVFTFNRSTSTARLYINGSLVRQGTWDYQYTIFDYPPTRAEYSRFVLGANIFFAEYVAVAYAYVRIYSRELSPEEIRWNLQNPSSPVTRGLEVWLHWDSFRGTQWLDKSGRGRHAAVHGTVFAYPHWQWVIGAYLQHGYPAASPLIITDFRFGGVSWTSGAFRGGAVQLMRVDGAYIDAAAGTGGGFAVGRYAAPNAALGFDAAWTPSDGYRGWITLWRVGGSVLNITQVGGHGVWVGGVSVRGYAGTVAAVLGDGLYVNGTRRIPLPLGANATSFSLLPASQGGLRALVRYAWVDAGVRYGVNSSQTYGGLAGVAYAPSATPSPWAYFVDFRWWPPVATWGILQSPPFPAVRQRQPNQVLTPVVVSGTPQVSASLWGPFGEVCLAQNSVAFGVRHVWLGASASACVLPAAYTASGSVQTALFNATAPVQLYFASPPIQHPYVANSVPGARFCSLNASHFLTPLLPLKAPGSTAVADKWACAPSDYSAGGYVAASQRGWALIAPAMRVFRINTTSVVYIGSGSAVLATGGAVPAMSAQAVDGRTWHLYTYGGVAVATTSLQTPPNVSRTGGAIAGIFGVPLSPSTLLSVWWADDVRYYVSAAGLADAPVVYVSSFTGAPVAVPAELNAPSGHSYYLGVLSNGTYVWAVPLTGPTHFSVYVSAPGYYTVRLYRGADKVWEKSAYLSPDTKLMIGPVDIPVFMPANPVSLYTPAAPNPPVFVPAVAMEMPPYAVGILLLGVFAAAYVSTREVSLASLIAGAVVAVLGVLINAPIYGAAGAFLLAFGLWNKARRQGSI
jgi:hypothetical protein